MEILSVLLGLYSWLVIAGLLVLMFLIARFYGEKSGRSGFQAWFAALAPAMLVGATLAILADDPRLALLGYLVLLGAGVSLVYASWHLLLEMTRGGE